MPFPALLIAGNFHEAGSLRKYSRIDAFGFRKLFLFYEFRVTPFCAKQEYNFL